MLELEKARENENPFRMKPKQILNKLESIAQASHRNKKDQGLYASTCIIKNASVRNLTNPPLQ